jgi:hypothetical protein
MQTFKATAELDCSEMCGKRFPLFREREKKLLLVGGMV